MEGPRIVDSVQGIVFCSPIFCQGFDPPQLNHLFTIVAALFIYIALLFLLNCYVVIMILFEEKILKMALPRLYHVICSLLRFLLQLLCTFFLEF